MKKRIDELTRSLNLVPGDLIPIETSNGTKSLDLGKTINDLMTSVNGELTASEESFNSKLSSLSLSVTNKINDSEQRLSTELNNLSSNTTQKIQELNQRVGAIPSQISGIDEKVNSNKTNITNVQNSVTSLNNSYQTKFAEVNTKINEAKTDYTNKFTETNSNVAAAQTKANEAYTLANTVNTSLTSINAELDNINSTVASADTAIRQQIDILDNEINTIKEDLTEVVNTCESTGITMIRTRDNNLGTTYLLTTIPYTNKHGKRNVIKKYILDINNPTQKSFPINKAIAKKAIFACNASSVFEDSERGWLIQGIQIQDGKAISEEFTRVTEVPNYYTLGVKKDGTLKAYRNGSYNAQKLLDDGVVNSFAFTSPVILDGQICTDVFSVSSSHAEKHPRQVIGQKADKTILVLTCEGRRIDEAGMTLTEAAQILLDKGCVFAYNLDGGGSAQTIWNGTMMNIPTDAKLGFVERLTPDILYVAKETPDDKQEELMRHNALNYKKNMDLINELKKERQKVDGLTESGVYIYVNPKGNDEKGDGTKSNPYRTIQKAFDTIPKVINKRRTIILAPGTYDEEPYLSGVIGSAVFVRSEQDNPDVTQKVDCRVRALRFYDMMGYVHIEGIGNIDGNIESKAFMLFSRCIYASISRCRFDRDSVSTQTNSIWWDGSFGSIGLSHFANQYRCIYGMNGSQVRVDDHNVIDGPCNTVLYSENAHIFKKGTNPWHIKSNVTTPEVKIGGGEIYGGHTQVWNNATYQNNWTSAGSLPLRYKREGDVCFLNGWVTKSTLDTTVIATIPKEFRPAYTIRKQGLFGGTALPQSCPPIININPTTGEVSLTNTGDNLSEIVIIDLVYSVS